MELSTKKKTVTFKRPQENKQIKALLKDLYAQIVEKDHKTAQKIELALISLSKYPLPLASGEDCFILQGFDQNLCKFVDEKLFQKTPVTSAEEEPIAGPSKEINSNNFVEEFTDKVDKEIQTDQINEEEAKDTDPVSKDSNEKRKFNVYRVQPNSKQDAVLIALYIQQEQYPSRPALTKKELILKAKPHTTYTIRNWNFVKILEKKKGLIKSRINENGVEEFMATTTGMGAGKLIWTKRDNVLNRMVSQNYHNHRHDDDCRALGCSVYRVVPPLTAKSLLQDHNIFIDMPPGTYEVVMVVDKNEPETLAAPTKYHKVESRSLKVGDILWIARSKINGDELVLPHIVERKRMDDFAASIKDGRFHEQKFRLRRCGLRHVIYLIENHPGAKYAGLPKDTLTQAKINTRVQDGFLIHVTDSLKGTKRYLDMMTSRITQELEGQHLRGSNTGNAGKELMTFDYFNAASSKSKPLTVKEIFIKMLVQLKGLSVEKALAITKEYDSPRALMEEYDRRQENEREKLLANLRYNNYMPKVGPSVSKTLSMLFNKMSFDNAPNGG